MPSGPRCRGPSCQSQFESFARHSCFSVSPSSRRCDVSRRPAIACLAKRTSDWRCWPLKRTDRSERRLKTGPANRADAAVDAAKTSTEVRKRTTVPSGRGIGSALVSCHYLPKWGRSSEARASYQAPLSSLKRRPQKLGPKLTQRQPAVDLRRF
jgi:hypothetical protein